MYVFEKIIDLYCSTFSTDSNDGQKVVRPNLLRWSPVH